MKYLGTHHDTGDKLPSVGNAIWLSFYLGQYEGFLMNFLDKRPCMAGEIQKDVYIDKRTYRQQLDEARDVDMIVLCIRCLPHKFIHFNNYYCSFSQQLVEYVYKLGYKNIKVELMSEPIEFIDVKRYLLLLKELRKALNHFRRDYNLQILAGAGDLHIETHRKYYRYLRDNGFHSFDCWSIHCLQDPLAEMIWAVKNLGNKPIHITEFTTLDRLLAYGADSSKTLWFLNECLTFAHKQSKIKSLLQVFPAKIEGAYKSWSVHNSKYLTKLEEFYNKYIKEEEVNNLDIKIPYGEWSLSVRCMQFLLEYNGYEPKYIDGKFGDLTLKALNEFQKDHGFTVTNYCDFKCLEKMIFEKEFAIACLNTIMNLKTKQERR